MVQIIGRKSCRDTQKAIRFCSERNITFQFVDLKERVLSAGEWKSIFLSVKAEDLIDTSNKYFKKEGYMYREYDAAEELLLHPDLITTPIIRHASKAIVGYNPDWLSIEGTKT